MMRGAGDATVSGSARSGSTACARRGPHALLVALDGGPFDLPEDVAAELARLVLELAQADVSRVVLDRRARRRGRCSRCASVGASVKTWTGQPALARPLRRAPACGRRARRDARTSARCRRGPRRRRRRGRRPRRGADARTGRAARGAIDRDDAELVDRCRRLGRDSDFTGQPASRAGIPRVAAPLAPAGQERDQRGGQSARDAASCCPRTRARGPRIALLRGSLRLRAAGSPSPRAARATTRPRPWPSRARAR